MKHMKLQHGLFTNFCGEHVVGGVGYVSHEKIQKIIYWNQIFRENNFISVSKNLSVEI